MSMYLEELKKVVADYSSAYKKVEHFQTLYNEHVPKGDQKTGVFGEAFIMEYIKSKYGNAKLTQTSTKSKDILYNDQDQNPVHVEVKTVSAYSEKRIMSSIGDKWDELFMVSLNEDFLPNGIWLIKKSQLLNNNSATNQGNPFSTQYSWGKDKSSLLWSIVKNEKGSISYKIKQANMRDPSKDVQTLNSKGKHLDLLADSVISDFEKYVKL